MSQEMNPAIADLFRLRGRSALVTGGGRGIGREICLLLAAAGAAVAVVDLDSMAAKEAAAAVVAQGGEAVAIEADVSDAQEVKTAFATALGALKRLDILVNNAAIVRRTPALETSAETWRHVMDVNLNAAFFCCCEAAVSMTQAGGGAIVNMASIMGLSGGGVYPIASYHASKGGLVNLTRGLAVEWADRKIRVNAVAPTWVRTELTKPLLDNLEMSSRLRDLMPLRVFADTIDVAAAVLYLVSPAAKVVTGHVLAVDGGYLAR